MWGNITKLHLVRNGYCYVGTQVHYGIVYTLGVPVLLGRSEDKGVGVLVPKVCW